MKRQVLLSVLLIIIASSAAYAVGFGDVLLSVPVIAKTAAPLFVIPEMFSDPGALPLGLAAIGLFSVPNAILLVNIYTDNPTGTRLWRRITTVTDGAMTLGFLGIAAYTIFADQDIGGWGTIIGAIYIALAIPAGVAFGLDFIPYPLEKITDS